MPWKETCAMEERIKFVLYYLENELSMSALCREFGISRKTGYKMIQRYIEGGLDGLRDISRTVHHHQNAVSRSVEAAILSVRGRYPTWGSRKLRAWLQSQDRTVKWPAASTFGKILSRHGLTVSRRRSRKSPPYRQPFVGCNYPNTVWSADLKGWFVTGDGTRCDPLTISDNYSRYLLRCQIVTPANYQMIRPIFEAAFREFGLPEAIRTDNGAPFATTALAGLSRLSVWWLRLGIQPERIAPGKPAQNGRHERMHRTLKAETATPPQPTLNQQQQAFDRFRQEYNQERPHEAIGQKPPISSYVPSARPYPLILPEMVYPDDMLLRKVRGHGDISWKHQDIYLTPALKGELVGLRQVADNLWDIYFSHVKLAQLDTFKVKLKHPPHKINKYENNN